MSKKKKEQRWEYNGPTLVGVALTSAPFVKGQPEIEKTTAEDGSVMFSFPIVKVGSRWKYKSILGEEELNHDREFADKMLKNYHTRVWGSDLPTKKTHDPIDQMALAWDTGLTERDGWLYLRVKPTTDELETLVDTRQARYTSMEYFEDWEDNQVSLSTAADQGRVFFMSKANVLLEEQDMSDENEVMKNDPVVEDAEVSEDILDEETLEGEVEESQELTEDSEATKLSMNKQLGLRLAKLDLRETIVEAREQEKNGRTLSASVVNTARKVLAYIDDSMSPYEAAVKATAVLLAVVPRTVPTVSQTEGLSKSEEEAVDDFTKTREFIKKTSYWTR